jgi:hypothetical protein
MAEQFTSTISRSMEGLVRPFETAFKLRQDPRVDPRLPPGEQDETSSLCWGRSNANPFQGTSSEIRDPEQEPRSPDSPGEVTWNELERTVKKIRVQNPDDEEQYVMIERIEEIVWQAGSGRVRQVYNHDNKNKKRRK